MIDELDDDPTGIVHPVWCRPELCDATEPLPGGFAAGEHRSAELQVVDGELELGVQLAQDQAVGGATPRMLWRFGTRRIELPLGVAQCLIDQAVTLFYQTTSDYQPPAAADGIFIPGARKASA